MSQQHFPPPPEDDLPEQMQVRRAKRARLLAADVEPYPISFERSHTISMLRATYPDLPADSGTGDQVAVVGRVIFLRNTGRLCFARLRDGDGSEVQAMISLAQVGDESLAEWKAYVDIGDHVGVVGEVISSKRGELSVLADRWVLVSKSLRPLPVAHKPMTEETRIRQRYVDLIVRPQAREMVQTRAAVIRSLRDSLHRRGFTEVETPMLQPLHGGATARPFVTHINAYDMDLYLRIAPELYLKRCVVGGIHRVFEINRNFRNEGADSSHSPEFAMLEAYQAYADYNTMARLTQEIIQEAALAAVGTLEPTHADGTEVDLAGQWPIVRLYEEVSRAVGEKVGPDSTAEELRELFGRHQIAFNPVWGPGRLAEELFDELVVPTLQRPTFVYDYPEETSPLTRPHRTTPGVVEKWDLYVRGVEVGTAYSELVDPVIQRERLVAQSLLAAQGDPEAMQLDEDFLRAMEYGMPPSGGVGMGIDRLLMALTGHGIRETILFPLVKPE